MVLPTYPFERRRYWIEPAAASPAPVPERAAPPERRAEPAAESGNVVPGVVEGVTYLGQDLCVFVRLTGREDPIVVRMNSEQGREAPAQPGDAVWCCWPPAASRVLTV